MGASGDLVQCDHPAIATGQFLNDLINGLHLNDLFTGYSEVSEQAFSGQPVGL